MTGTLASTRLRRLAQAPRRPQAGDPAPEGEQACELCGRPIAERHRHLLDLRDRELRCACRPCATLFDSAAAGGGRHRLVPERRLRLDGFALDDAMWADLQLPVDLAFFIREEGAGGRVRAFYPSPMGPTESALALDAWRRLEAANPVLGTLAPDVEALLVDRARGARRQWLVPIDDCYALVGLIRTHWRGFTGGAAVWRSIAGFLDDVDGRSRAHAGR